MAKEIGMFEIVIRGTKVEGPTKAYIQYRVQESTDTTLQSGVKSKELDTPDLAKVFHDSDAVTEFWAEQLAAIESDEGIA